MGQVTTIGGSGDISPTNISISATVRALCSARRVKPELIALSIGMTKSTIYSRLRVATPWLAEEVDKIARFFGIRVGDLYDGLGGRLGPTDPDGPLAQSVELRTFNPLVTNEDFAKVIPFRPRNIPQDVSLLTAAQA